MPEIHIGLWADGEPGHFCGVDEGGLPSGEDDVKAFGGDIGDGGGES